MGAAFARPVLSPSSFVQLQQIIHAHYERMMPPLTLAAIASGLGWLILVRAEWNSPHFWLVTLAAGAMVLAAALTLAVNIPINTQLMTWSATAPPDNLRGIWSPWEKIHTIRTILWLGAFALEVFAVGAFGSSNASSHP